MMGKPGFYIIVVLVFLAACTSSPGGLPAGDGSLASSPPATPTNTGVTIPVPTVPAEQNPRLAGANLITVPQWSRPDAIPPIYDPEFIPGDQADLPDEDLVLAIAWGGEAKAYPIAVLQFREMVNDEMAGIPILVSW
jgi:hypothetical protein